MKNAAPFFLLSMSACLSEGHSGLEILNVPPPDDDCSFPADGETKQSSGFYDPRGLFGAAPPAYVMAVVVQNNMQSDNERDADGTVLRPGANDVFVEGFRSCWIAISPDAGENADDIDCADLPEGQTALLPSSGIVASGGGKAAFAFGVLTTAHLQSLFGAGFVAPLIPDVGAFATTDFNGDPITLYSLNSQNPSDPATRDPAWGDFPTSREARVLLKTRAVSYKGDGSRVLSNWFLFAIDICVGCFASLCGPLAPVSCPGETCSGIACPGSLTCPDSSACTAGSTCPATLCDSSGTCPGGGACQPPFQGFEGFAPQPGTCLPFQTFDGACTPFSSCP